MRPLPRLAVEVVLPSLIAMLMVFIIMLVVVQVVSGRRNQDLYLSAALLVPALSGAFVALRLRSRTPR